MESKGSSSGRAFLAGAFGGAFAVAVLVAVAAVLLPRVGPRLKSRMMSSGCCSDEMRPCMDKCGCGPAPSQDGPEE